MKTFEISFPLSTKRVVKSIIVAGDKEELQDACRNTFGRVKSGHKGIIYEIKEVEE